tara:strand:- start:45 stop:755 length:711 start_codon:yes stop_codon:yes gene_type:complete
MARYSKPSGTRGSTSAGNPNVVKEDRDNPKKRKSRFFDSKKAYRYGRRRSIITLNGRVFDAKMTPTVTRIEYALSYFKNKKYIACSDDKNRQMNASLIDARGRRVLNTLGCSVENQYGKQYHYVEDAGERYARVGIEHIENVNIKDPEFSILKPTLYTIEDHFPNKNDPIYQLDDRIPTYNLRDMARKKAAKNNCSVITAHLVSINQGHKRGRKLRHFYDCDKMARDNIYRVEGGR